MTPPDPCLGDQSNRRPHHAVTTYSQRHRSRINRIFSVTHQQTEDYRGWTDSELRACAVAAEHLRSADLFGGWQVPESARPAWRCQRCPCHRRDTA